MPRYELRTQPRRWLPALKPRRLVQIPKSLTTPWDFITGSRHIGTTFLGADSTTSLSPDNGTARNGVWGRDTNEAYVEGAIGGSGIGVYTWACGNADGYLRCRPGNLGTHFAGVAFRWTSDSNFWFVGWAGDGGVFLFKVVAGSFIELFPLGGSTRINRTWTSGDEVGVEFIGSTIRVFINGVQQGSDLTDSFNSTATDHGVCVNDTEVRIADCHYDHPDAAYGRINGGVLELFVEGTESGNLYSRAVQDDLSYTKAFFYYKVQVDTDTLEGVSVMLLESGVYEAGPGGADVGGGQSQNYMLSMGFAGNTLAIHRRLYDLVGAPTVPSVFQNLVSQAQALTGATDYYVGFAAYHDGSTNQLKGWIDTSPLDVSSLPTDLSSLGTADISTTDNNIPAGTFSMLSVWNGHHGVSSPTDATVLVTPLLFETNFSTGGVNVNLGLATETDSSAAVTLTKVITLGFATETDSGLDSSEVKTVQLGLPTETDETFALGQTTKVFTFGIATETDSSAALTLIKTVQLGFATETDSSAPLTLVKALTFGQAQETDEAFPLSFTEVAQLGLASEVDEAFALTIAFIFTFDFGFASETDSSAAVTLTKVVTLGIATETDSGLDSAETKAVTLGLASETDTSQPVTLTKTVTLGLATETDTALPLSFAIAKTLNQASETDTSQPVTVNKVVTLGLATETDEAFPISISTASTFTLAYAQETDSSAPLTMSKTVQLGLATETDTAQPLAFVKVVTLGQCTEADTAQQQTVFKTITLGQAVETDTVFPVQPFTKTKQLGLATELDSALAIFIFDDSTPLPTIPDLAMHGSERMFDAYAERVHVAFANRLLEASSD